MRPYYDGCKHVWQVCSAPKPHSMGFMQRLEPCFGTFCTHLTSSRTGTKRKSLKAGFFVQASKT